METEMERLKRNTEEQRSKQNLEAIATWFGEVEREWDVALRESERVFKWMTIVLFIQLFLSVISNPLWIVAFFVFWILVWKNHSYHEKIEYAKGKIMGGHKMLFLLGLASHDIEDEINKQMKRQRRTTFSSLFQRPKEFFERMKEKQTKEGYA